MTCDTFTCHVALIADVVLPSDMLGLALGGPLKGWSVIPNIPLSKGQYPNIPVSKEQYSKFRFNIPIYFKGPIKANIPGLISQFQRPNIPISYPKKANIPISQIASRVPSKPTR